ncbi:MAG TPA: alpha/beta fold hydrolase [Phycisphaerae bacterium]
MTKILSDEVVIQAGTVRLAGTLTIPAEAGGMIVFAHGSGSSRHSPRNRYVARVLQQAGFATLLMDLLTRDEERADEFSGRFRFDVPLLATRLVAATDWLGQQDESGELPIGYFGASTGAAAALIAAAERPQVVRAVVSRGGRPDLAGDSLQRVEAPTLLIVGGADRPVIPLNQQALEKLGATAKRLEIVPGATHLFEEPGALEAVAALASDWFERYLAPAGMAARRD